MRTDIQEESMGKNNIEVVIDTVSRVGEYIAIAFLSDTVLTSFTPRFALDAQSDAMADVTSFPAGMVLPLEFTEVKVFTGEVALFKGDF